MPVPALASAVLALASAVPVQEPEPPPPEPPAAEPAPAPPAAQEPLFGGERPWWEDGEDLIHRLDFGLLFDFYSAFSEKSDSDGAYNELRVRSAQLHARAPVDDTASLYATMAFADDGGGSEFLLREAAARVTRLPLPFWPDNFHLLVGQYYADLGAWNSVLPHEFPAPHLDGVRRVFLGGNLAARGVEAHHLIPFREGSFRWSFGLAGEAEGHDADPDDYGLRTAGEPDRFGRFGFRNWAANARGEGQWRLGSAGNVRAGVSALVVPNEVKYTDLGTAGVARDEAGHWLGGLDAGWRLETAAGERAHELSVEVWLDDDEYRVSPTALVGERERGEWLMYEYTAGRNWSGGALLSRFDLPSPGAEVDGHQHSAWVSYRFSSVNRFSVFLTHTNPGPGEEKWYTLGGQWVFTIGAPRDTGRVMWN